MIKKRDLVVELGLNCLEARAFTKGDMLLMAIAKASKRVIDIMDNNIKEKWVRK